METILFWLLLAAIAGLSAVTLLYALEIAAAFPAARRPPLPPADAPRPAAAILVPAHNEELVLRDTLAAILAAKGEKDRLLVVADNCTDATASLARAAGVEVLERHDTQRRGKGYALDAGMRLLAETPPDIVIIIDADCFPARDAFERLVSMTAATQRPVQSLSLMTVPEGAALNLQVAQFAFALKNQVRMRGLHYLGIPCHLAGSGMAFPWSMISQMDLAHGHLVEDMKLGLDLACRGKGPVFCEGAVVLSPFPETEGALETQRNRWVGGHLALTTQALKGLPGLLARGNVIGALTTIATVIPPLTILLALLLGSLLAAMAAALLMPGSMVLPALSAANLLIFVLATGAAWYRFGRGMLPARSLKRLPLLLLARLAKIPGAIKASRNGAWIRTDRGSGPR